MTDNTPLNADDELRNFIHDWLVGEYEPSTGVHLINVDKLMQRILADRKKHELEARIDENNMYIRELTRHYFPSGPSEPHIPLVQFHERIAELKAQQEEEI